MAAQQRLRVREAVMITYSELRQEHTVDVTLEECRRRPPPVGCDYDEMIAPVEKILLTNNLSF